MIIKFLFSDILSFPFSISPDVQFGFQKTIESKFQDIRMAGSAVTIQKIILIACGTFNPPTIMHLRIFELARDYFNKLGGLEVIGGIISPVNDRYGKKDMAEGRHRLAMAKAAASAIPWVKVSSWEVENTDWNRTLAVLDYHQTQIDGYLNGSVKDFANWMPDPLRMPKGTTVRFKLLCGADVLDSFNIPNLWSESDMKTITSDYGMVVISRDGVDPRISISKNSTISQFEENIHLVSEWMSNNISSTKIRSAVRTKQSIRFFVPDLVVSYINTNGLYSDPE